MHLEHTYPGLITGKHPNGKLPRIESVNILQAVEKKEKTPVGGKNFAQIVHI